jgi:NADH-quinone oxidoreductase subunit C
VEVCRFLKERRGFRLVSVTAVDWWPQEPRFEVVYHVHSIEHNERLRLKCGVAGGAPEIDSVSGVWRSANWYEREVFDLFGIVFRNHPDLRRIMMPDEWQGHPLRKDYPVHGHKYSYQDE